MSLQELVFSLYEFLADVHLFVMIPVVLCGAIFFKRLSMPFRYMFGYMLSWLLVQALMTVTSYFGIYNLVLVPVLALTEFCILSLLYYKYFSLGNSRPLKIAGFISFPLILFANIFSMLEAFNPQQFQAYGMVLACSAIIFYSVRFLLKSLANTQQDIDRELFHLNTVILSYNAFRLLIFASVNFMLNQATHFTAYFWLAFVVGTVLFDLAIGYLLWKHGKNRKVLRFGLQ
jgi:hypothetical protein